MQTKKIMFSAFQDNESTSNDNYLTFTNFLVNEGKLIVHNCLQNHNDLLGPTYLFKLGIKILFLSGNAFDGHSTFTTPIDGYYEFSFAGTAGIERKDFPDKDGTIVGK